MNTFKIFLAVLIGVLALSSRVDAACNVCSTASYAACINSTAFKICPDGATALDQIKSCPEGQFCYDVQGVCKPDDGRALACVMAECGTCTGKFACISQREFAFCDADGNQGVTGTCPENQVCNTDQFATSQSICALSCLHEPTCSNAEVEVPVQDFKDSCAGVAGYHANIYDKTCTQYVYCELSGTEWVALLYTCSTTKPYFNKTTKVCQATKPTGC